MQNMTHGWWWWFRANNWRVFPVGVVEGKQQKCGAGGKGKNCSLLLVVVVVVV